MKTLLMVPAYNESESIESVIEEIEKKCPDVDYLVINDCSSDETESILKNAHAHYVSAPVNLGIGGAVQTGYKYALKNGYDIAIQVDGDGQHDVAYVPKMVELIESGEADMVIGSRFVAKEGFQSSTTRRLGIKLLSTLIFICCGKHIKDVTSGFRACDRRFIALFASDYPDDYPEPEVLVTSVLHRGKIVELPVVMRERAGGKSSINLKKSIYYMIKVSLAIIVTRVSLGVRR